MVQLLDENVASRQHAKLRAEALWPRIVRFEALCKSAHVSEAVLDFEAHFLWILQPVYREMLSLVACGHMRVAEHLAWRVFSSIYQEKGIHIIKLAGVFGVGCMIGWLDGVWIVV